MSFWGNGSLVVLAPKRGFFSSDMKSLDKLLGILLGGLLFLLPVFFLPVTGDFFDFNKLVLLVLGVLLGLLVWSLSCMKGEFKVRLTPLDLPVLLFAFSVLASGLITLPNKIVPFVFSGEATAVLAGTVLYFLVVQYSRDEDKRTGGMSLLNWLLAGGALAGIVSVFSVLGGWGIAAGFLPVPNWLNQPTFNTFGLPLAGIMFFIALLPLAVGKVLEDVKGKLKEGKGKYSILYTLYSILILAGLAATVYNSLPGKPAFPRTLPFDTGWSIALETLKKSPVLGVGPGNFVEAFNRFRPVEYNLSDVWNLRFVSSSDWYLHVFTTTGLLGILALGLVLFVIYRILKDAKGKLKEGKGYLPAQAAAIQYTIYIILLLFLLLPATLLTLVVFYAMLGVLAASHGRDFRLELAASDGGGRTNLLPGILAALFTLTLALTLYFGSRVYAAEMAYRQALNAVAANNGVQAYNSMLEAIRKNVNVARYRIDNSQINLAIANNIARKQDLTDQDRQTVSQLIQQAISEAKAAVALGQARSEHWENLARLYQALIPFAKDADQFAIATYQQAIALDPVNPELRIALGGVFYGLGRYEDAARVFELAAAAKPNHANAHFNLAAALREKKDTARAVTEMEQVLQLVDVDSQDYKTAQTELDKLRGKLKEEQEATRAAQPETLKTAAPAGEPVIKPPLELPAESAPPSPPADGESAEPTPIPAPQE